MFLLSECADYNSFYIRVENEAILDKVFSTLFDVIEGELKYFLSKEEFLGINKDSLIIKPIKLHRIYSYSTYDVLIDAIKREKDYRTQLFDDIYNYSKCIDLTYSEGGINLIDAAINSLPMKYIDNIGIFDYFKNEGKARELWNILDYWKLHREFVHFIQLKVNTIVNNGNDAIDIFLPHHASWISGYCAPPIKFYFRSEKELYNFINTKSDIYAMGL